MFKYYGKRDNRFINSKNTINSPIIIGTVINLITNTTGRTITVNIITKILYNLDGFLVYITYGLSAAGSASLKS